MSLSDDIRRVFRELKSYYDELHGESPRAAAILAVASLEDELERLILTKFPDTITDAQWKNIFGPASQMF